MKSYIEPLNAADALDVLYAHGIPFGDISYRRDNDEDAVLHGPGGDKVLRTPDDVIAALGDDAARALAELARTRQVILFTCHEEIVESMRSADPALNVVEL